eukprot:3296486-Alexandrium_andersonii.AAC.1
MAARSVLTCERGGADEVAVAPRKILTCDFCRSKTDSANPCNGAKSKFRNRLCLPWAKGPPIEPKGKCCYPCKGTWIVGAWRE